MSPLLPAALLWFGLAGCGPEAAPPESSRNIVLVDIDSVRADLLDPLPGGACLSPTLRDLASRGVVFTSAFSQSGWTIPAVVSILTGNPPPLQGLGQYAPERILSRGNTLPRVLAAYGYQTAVLASTQGWLNARGGLGFQVGDPIPVDGPGPVAGVRLADQVRTWLERDAREPFFLLVHNYDVTKMLPLLPAPVVHVLDPDPGGCPLGELSGVWRGLAATHGPEAAQRHMVAHYRASFAHFDQVLAALVGGLEATGRLDRTVLVITSNHGEDLGEHYLGSNHCVLYDSVLRIPLVIVDPARNQGRVVAQGVQTIDIAPTILDYAGIPPDLGMSGRSLLPLLAPDGAVEWPARPVYSVTNTHNLSVRTDRWKVLVTDGPSRPGAPGFYDDRHPDPQETWEAYDLSADPGERRNLLLEAEGGPPEVASLRLGLEAFRQRQLALTQGMPLVPPSPALQKALREQGYWQTSQGGPAGPARDEVGPPR